MNLINARLKILKNKHTNAYSIVKIENDPAHKEYLYIYNFEDLTKAHKAVLSIKHNGMDKPEYFYEFNEAAKKDFVVSYMDRFVIRGETTVRLVYFTDNTTNIVYYYENGEEKIANFSDIIFVTKEKNPEYFL